VRVITVINSLAESGAERSLAELVPLLEDGGVDVKLLCLHRRPEIGEGGAITNGHDVQFAEQNDWLGRVRELRRMIAQTRPDLIHTTLFESNVTGRFGARGTGVPVLTSLVNTPYEPIRLEDPNITAWKLRVVKGIDGWTARRYTRHFHAITHAVAAAAERDLRIRECDITVVERGRDLGRLGEPGTERRARARSSLALGANEVVLATVGRQEYQKGQWHLLEAMVSLASTHPQARLLVAGRRGNASNRLDAVMQAPSLNGVIRLLGHREDAPEILAASDIFVFPSLFEGLGGALIEAMALGLPVVASDLPAIREVVEPGRNAVLVPPGSSSALSRALVAMIDDAPRRRAMGERSRQIFLERFTIERSAAKMLSLFERVAADGRVVSR
jgi:glycosyltransferase involved in cell wall biosynthesis